MGRSFRLIGFLICTGLALSFLTGVPAQSQEKGTSKQAQLNLEQDSKSFQTSISENGLVVFTLKDDIQWDLSDAKDAIRVMGLAASPKQNPQTPSVFTLEVPNVRVEEVLGFLRSLAQVNAAERDYSITLTPPEDFSESQPKRSHEIQAFSGSRRTGVPWNIDRTDQLSTTLDGAYEFDLTGQGVDIYILDSGVLTSHSEFTGREVLSINPAGGQSSDCSGHGTHVAGTALGRTVGIATAARLINVQVFPRSGCTGTGADLIAALTYIRDNHNYARRAAVNMSLGGPASTIVDDLVLQLHERGIVTIAASGNEGTNACLSSPARASVAITVNNSMISGGIDTDYPSSNFGSCTDIYAPGTNIYSASWMSTTGYRTTSGTSMAAPLVAGVVAGILEANPTANADQISAKLLAAAAPVNFIPSIASDAKKFIQFGPRLRGYYPSSAEQALGFATESSLKFEWKKFQEQSLVPLSQVGVEVLATKDGGGSVLASCSVATSQTSCSIVRPAGSHPSLYLRTTGLARGNLVRSSEISEIELLSTHNDNGPWRQLSVGSAIGCAIDKTLDLYCWGDGIDRASGLVVGGANRSFTPVRVALAGKVSLVEVGASGTICTVSAVGAQLSCWGTNFGRMVNNTTTTPVSAPRSMGLSNVRTIALGNSGRACAVNTSNQLHCWGSTLGQSTDFSIPRLITSGVADVSVGGSHYCRVSTVGSVTCVGSNHRGQLGNGTLTDSSVGTQVVGISGAVALRTSDDVTCALTSASSVLCWGWNSNSGSLFNTQRPQSAISVTSGVSSFALDFKSLCVRRTSPVTINCTSGSSGGSVVPFGANQDFSFQSKDLELSMETLCSLTNGGKILCQGFGGFGLIAAGGRFRENSLTQLNTIPFPLEVTKSVIPLRLQGASRFETAVEISKASFPSGVSKVFIVSGQNFPDALAAGPVAALQNGALLLTHPSFLPDAVAAEISRLAPSEIIVIGGNSAVSPEVEQRLRTLAPSVSRVGGASRFETAVLVNQLQHQSAATVFVTTGLNYPDALSAAAAAHNAQAPLLLVDGAATGLPVQVRNYVASLRPIRIVVLGGTSAVSAGVFSELSGIAATQRVSGAGRIDTSVAVGREFFAHSDSALLAFAWNFPDALAGSMLAARKSAPLFIVNSSCVPRSVINEFRRLGVSELFVLGGPAALSERVREIEPCD